MILKSNVAKVFMFAVSQKVGFKQNYSTFQIIISNIFRFPVYRVQYSSTANACNVIDMEYSDIDYIPLHWP